MYLKARRLGKEEEGKDNVLESRESIEELVKMEAGRRTDNGEGWEGTSESKKR